ncbi:MAG: nucleotidyltransferase substrate binding protein [Magnetococcus sp. DMHC-8]
MSRLSVDTLELAVAAIGQGLVEHEQYPNVLSIRDGVIQRFEIAMDLSWKLLQRFLRERFDVDTDRLRSRKDIFREAAIKGLIVDVERWLAHYEARNNTSHIYDAALADRTFAQVQAFLPDARALVVQLQDIA